ncbi:MAG: uracil-DNA glycosylase [Sedimentisphaerales bacterium]|jgi:DNA polymerase
MKSNPDIKKAVRQHAEMAEFFSGGLTVKKLTAENAEKEIKLTSVNPPLGEVSAVKIARPPSSPENIKELENIAEQTRKCRKCDLGSLRKNAVPGEGNTSARIMFVGEAPGADEDTQARPFVGRAGQLLDKIIAACGLKREDVWIGNILKCRPPDNRDPRPEEIIACIPYLQRQIELINPEIIVALGAHAAKTLLDTPKAIGQLRGIFHKYQPGIGNKPVKLMPTFHPAYLLRNYSDDNRRKVWEDMKKVLAELGLPVPR